MCKVAKIKSKLTPVEYYPTPLNGRFGKHTGGHWHEWNGLCPFHADKKAGSFVINKKTGAFKCFSCGAKGGDIISFHAQYYSVSNGEAIKQLWRAVK